MKILISTLLMILSFSGLALAETTTFKQQILPIDCVYEVVDVGTQKLRYITPDTCPIDPGPPIVTEPSAPTIPSETPTQALPSNSIVRWSYNPTVVVISPLNPSLGAKPQEPEQVQGAISVIKDVIVQNRDSLLLLMILVSIWWLLIVSLKKSNSNR